MRTKKLHIASSFALLAALFCGGAAFCADTTGTAGAQFLKLGAGARASAMGEGASAATDDASAIYWNPAGILNSKKISVSLMHAAMLEEMSYQFLGYSQRLGDTSAFGLGVSRLAAGDIKHTDSNGTETGDSSSPADMAVSIGYAAGSYSGWSFGAAAKYIRSSIVKTASAFAADAGILSPNLVGGRLRVSLVAQNIGTKLKFDSKADPLPAVVKTGAYIAVTRRLATSMELSLPNDNSPYASAGIEYWFSQSDSWKFAGRAGVNTRSLGDSDGLSGFSAGFGAEMGTLCLDYAFIPFGDLGNTHRVSLGLGFGNTGS